MTRSSPRSHRRWRACIASTLTRRTDAEDCRAKVAAAEAGTGYGLDFGYTFYEVASDGSLAGQSVSSGFADGELCKQGSVDDITMSLEGSTLRLSETRTLADDYAADEAGVCWTDAAKAAASANSCSQLTTLTATFVENL